MSIPVPSIAIAGATVLAPIFCQLTGNTQVALHEASAVFVFVAGLVWWLSRKLQKIEDDIVSLKDELKSRPCVKNGDGSCPI